MYAHVCVKTTQTAEGFFFLLVSEGETRVYKKMKRGRMKKSCESCPGERKRFKIGERETVIRRFWKTHTDTQTHTHTHTKETTSCPCTVTVTATVVCVSFSHYVDGMIPIMSDRGSLCKHHV